MQYKSLWGKDLSFSWLFIAVCFSQWTLLYWQGKELNESWLKVCRRYVQCKCLGRSHFILPSDAAQEHLIMAKGSHVLAWLVMESSLTCAYGYRVYCKDIGNKITLFLSLTQKLASSNAVAFHSIPGSCCIVSPEVCTMACWEGTTVR